MYQGLVKAAWTEADNRWTGLLKTNDRGVMAGQERGRRFLIEREKQEPI